MTGRGSFGRLRAALAANSVGGATPGAGVVVQTHDFPDHDAVAAAFGLSRLLARFGFAPRIVHRGRVRSHSLLAMVREFGVPLERVRGDPPPELADLPLVVVDGSPACANARPLAGRLAAVVDHHPNPGGLDCAFVDVRTSYGSCSSIVSDYWDEAGLIPDRDSATALLMGIQMDTDFLSRRVSPADLDAHHRLFFRADWEFSARVVKASLSLRDLPAFEAAVKRARVQGQLFFTTVPLECTQELISIMADFFLRLKEISATVIVELGGDRYHVSIRSRSPDLSAAALAKLAMAGLGEGGGHDHMAGGVLAQSTYPGDDAMFARFVEAVEAAQENQ